MPRPLVVLTSLPSIHAAIVKGALEAEGIQVTLDRPALGTVYGFEGGMWATQLLVAEDDVERARAILAEIESSDV